MESFCYQCEQTMGGRGCTARSNCGKDPGASVLQDLAIHAAKGISMYAHRAALLGEVDDELAREVIQALFSTGTNVNFDPVRLVALVRSLGRSLERARALYERACRARGQKPEVLDGPASFCPASTDAALLEQASVASILGRMKRLGADLVGLQELLTYGLKGLCAYAEHARVLGRTDRSVHAFIFEALDLLTREQPAPEELLSAALRCGEVNLKAMGLLHTAHVERFGAPEPTAVRVSAVKGKCILVSGHDLVDLEQLLEQTAGKGINVYTHGEMLPAHGYPGLRRHPHLCGNYGSAWQNQQAEFAAFPGAILMTTNCIQAPAASYQRRIFTSGMVAWPNVTHIAGHDFARVIQAALGSPGFTADEPERRITVGFGHEAVLGVADRVIAAVKSGAIRRFFLIGGCDGARPGRDYFTRLAEAIPRDCVILTLACGKYRFNTLDFGDIGGIPRLLDIGQCNDAYSAVQIAAALAQAFQTDVNSLPLSLVLSWYEQKAVAVLLSLLHLGIKNIRLGPSLPAFVTPAALQILVDKFGIQPIKTVEEDLRAMLGA